MSKADFKKAVIHGVIGFLILATIFIALNFSAIYKVVTYKSQKKVPVQQPTASINIEQNSLYIPAINTTAKIVFAKEINEQQFQKMLETAVVHYPNTALPGEIGNSYIFGHSSDYLWSKGDYKTIFALLPQLQKGDVIHVRGNGEQVFTYKVFNAKIILPDQMEYLSQETNGKKILTLQTSYPLGSAAKRYIVMAVME